MSRLTSPATNKRYNTAQVCRVWKLSSSNVYSFRSRQGASAASPARRRGPSGPCSDDELVKRMVAVLEASPFHGEGYRKVWARLRHSGTRTSKERVRRLMRENDLRATHFPKRTRGNKAHDGTITTQQPDEMWGTDATASMARNEGLAFVFWLVDHCTGECLGLHASASGSRFEAIEPLRQGVRRSFGRFEHGVAIGVALRHDHGPQYISADFQAELRFLGIESSPSFIAEPECNGVAERFVRTLKEQLLWVKTFDTIERLRQALCLFKHDYNDGWSPNTAARPQVRARLTQPAAQAT